MNLIIHSRFLGTLLLFSLVSFHLIKAQDIDSLNLNNDPLIHSSPRPFTTAISLSDEQLADLDMEEFADWLVQLPGYYPYDRGGYAQPSRGMFLGMMPWNNSINFRGREPPDHLLGSP